MRLKTLEEGLKHAPTFSMNSNGSPKNGKSSNFFGILSTNTRMIKRSASQPRASTITKSSMQMTDEKQDSRERRPVNSLKKRSTSGESLLKKGLWASRNKVIDSGEKENAEMNKNAMVDNEICNNDEVRETENIKDKIVGNKEMKGLEIADIDTEDVVSGFLYDKLQKEVINLRKSCDLKDSTLNSKDDEIKVSYRQSVCACVCISENVESLQRYICSFQMLMKKIDTLNRAIEVESRKMKREAATREKDSTIIKADEKIRITNSSKRLAIILNF